MTSVLLGSYVRVQAADPSAFQPFPAVEFLRIAAVQLRALGPVGPVVYGLIFAGFVSAMISTLDTYFVVVGHSLLRDLPADRFRDTTAARPLPRALVVFTISAVGAAVFPTFLAISHRGFDINILLYVATSSPFILVPAVLSTSRKGSANGPAILGSVSAGVAGTIGYLWWVLEGIRSSYGTPALASWYDRMYLAPIAACVAALVGFWLGGRLAPSRKVAAQVVAK